jgi:hypothetical protein
MSTSGSFSPPLVLVLAPSNSRDLSWQSRTVSWRRSLSPKLYLLPWKASVWQTSISSCVLSDWMLICSHKRLVLLFRFVYQHYISFLILHDIWRIKRHRTACCYLIPTPKLFLLIQHQHLQCFCVAITTCQSWKRLKFTNGMEWDDEREAWMD